MWHTFHTWGVGHASACGLKGAREGQTVTRCTEAGVYAPGFVTAVVAVLQASLGGVLALPQQPGYAGDKRGRETDENAVAEEREGMLMGTSPKPHRELRPFHIFAGQDALPAREIPLFRVRAAGRRRLCYRKTADVQGCFKQLGGVLIELIARGHQRALTSPLGAFERSRTPILQLPIAVARARCRNPTLDGPGGPL